MSQRGIRFQYRKIWDHGPKNLLMTSSNTLRKSKNAKNKKVAGSHGFGNSISYWWYLLEADFLCFYIVLWKWINSRRYENRSTFYFLVPGAKDKRTILTLICSWQLWVKLLFLLKNANFLQKNADISKIKTALVLKVIFSETAHVCILTYQIRYHFQKPY